MVVKLIAIVPDGCEATQTHECNGTDDTATRGHTTCTSQEKADGDDSVWIYHNKYGEYGHHTRTKTITTIKDGVETDYTVTDLWNEEKTFEVRPNPTNTDKNFQEHLRTGIIGAFKYGGQGLNPTIAYHDEGDWRFVTPSTG
ncbi:hypothetical protein L486_07275 [Kwoniella mangroviensis CBS 10435]|uniref:Uncharacterized protein n=1 Tax=Kwoniella mangroviensis CBS 10435 TaxID=1331196 RepID=A0A1B9II57_9TREE|nr:hypothetical protein L486_07275 [Kwoniella mangroviensis CBS 10435]